MSSTIKINSKGAVFHLYIFLIAGLAFSFYSYSTNNSLQMELSQITQDMTLRSNNSEGCLAELNSIKDQVANCQQSIKPILDTKAQLSNNISDCKNSISNNNLQISACNSKLSSVNSQTSECNAELQVYGSCYA